jgi:putative ABC transport system ATP-binding protein
MLGTTPFALDRALVVSSGTSWAGFHSFHPAFHTGVFGAITPAARAARSSSVRTSLCCPSGSAQRHSLSAFTQVPFDPMIARWLVKRAFLRSTIAEGVHGPTMRWEHMPLSSKEGSDAAPPVVEMAVVEMVGVSKRYAGARESEAEGAVTLVEALRDVSVTVQTGELVAIIGPSGSGKSTLLNLMGALDRPTSGLVRIHGQDLAALDDDGLTHLRRDRIGFVFQFFNLLPTLSALENVMLPSLLAGRATKEVRAKALEQLAAVGLAKRQAHRPDQLSGGEMQRVAIARALVGDPPLVLADEPTGNLDTKTGEDVLRLLLGAAGTRSVVLVTHDPRIAERADRILTIRDGIVESDAARSTGIRNAG